MAFTVANAKTNQLSQAEKHNKYSIDHYVIDMNAKNSSHTIVVKHALGSRNILDVGCGVGYIGHKLKELQPCTVDGIEIDDEAAQAARQVLDQVYHFAVGSHQDSAYLEFLHNNQTYDCIIFADLIEHLVDPGQVLADFSSKLSKNGKIIISIPNIAHMDVIAGLLDGKFNYSDAGILDSTHLRFFTKNSFYEFIDNINTQYHTSFHASHLQSTYTDDVSCLDQDLISQTIHSRDLYIFQNIFELTITAHPARHQVRHTHHFAKIAAAIEASHYYQQENAQLRASLAHRDQMIQNMTNSISWRLTAPLRKVNAKLRRK